MVICDTRWFPVYMWKPLSLLQANGQLAKTLINLNITASLVADS